ncbi:MAG: hypothetical protein V2A34_02470 [Lentisphaerota bacterium]
MDNKKLTRNDIEKALKDAGYKKVTFVPLVITEQPKGSERGAQAVGVGVLDVFIDPAHLAGEKNYTALKVLADLKAQYRELQEFSGAIIARWLRGVE